MYVRTQEFLGQIPAAYIGWSPPPDMGELGATLGFTPIEENTVQDLIGRGIRNENALANRLLFDRHPGQRGQTLTPGTARAREWITIRDGLVRPKLAAVPRSIPTRPCCILAPVASNIADPKNLGTHREASEANGIIYTGRAGFVDLGHLREECDLTEFVWTRLQGAGGAPATIPTVQGEANIVRQVPRHLWVPVAQAIAFDDGLGHEIASYDAKVPGGHNSAFSPEDLCSNFIGTVVARRAIGKGGPFEANVTMELGRVLNELRAQPPAETRKAFTLINGRWIDFAGPRSILNSNYLKRRNFTRTPFKVGHPSDAQPPGWVRASFGSAESFYTYSHTLGKTIPKTTFGAEIQRIRNDARALYGHDFDKP